MNTMRLFPRLFISLALISAFQAGRIDRIAAQETSSSITSDAKLFDLFVQICVQNLHTPRQAMSVLEEAGWSRKPITDFEENNLFSNILFLGLKSEHSALYLSPDGNNSFVFGPDDNDLNPNSKCMLSTTSAHATPYVEWAEKTFKDQKYSRLKGKRFGNLRQEWQSQTFPKNLSETLPLDAMTVHSSLSAGGITRADTQISVTGLTPN